MDEDLYVGIESGDVECIRDELPPLFLFGDCRNRLPTEVLLYIIIVVRTNVEVANSAVGVSPQIGAAAATLFQCNSAALRAFHTHRHTPAGLTNPTAFFGLLAAARNEPRHT